MKRMLWILCVLTATSSVVTAPSLGQIILYRAKELPRYTTSRYPVGAGNGINDLGHVAGISQRTYGFNRGVRWSVDGEMLDLGSLNQIPGSSTANALNELGNVAGSSSSDTAFNEAFLWTPARGMIGLGHLDGDFAYSIARGMNDLDEVVGNTIANGHGQDGGSPVAFIWDEVHGMRELPDIPGGAYGCGAFDINNESWAAGQGYGIYGEEACVWLPDGNVMGLGDLPGGGFGSIALAINDLGQVVGQGYSASGLEAMLWDSEHGMIGLGFLPGTTPKSAAYALNERGQVVGQAYYMAVGMRDKAFIWDAAHGIRELNTLLDARSRGPWMWLSEASGINNAGQIVATNANRYTAVVLTPFTLADMNCDGTVNTFDIDGFILTLSAVAGDAADAAEYAERYPGCHGDWAADADQDGSVNMFDIGAFVAMLGG